eukprot:scaffold7349_cov173-Amphora_coffeaeformis.AAC.27
MAASATTTTEETEKERMGSTVSCFEFVLPQNQPRWESSDTTPSFQESWVLVTLERIQETSLANTFFYWCGTTYLLVSTAPFNTL